MKIILINRAFQWLEMRIERTYSLQSGDEWLNVTVNYEYNAKGEVNYGGERELVFKSGPSEWFDLDEMITLREELEKFIKKENIESEEISFLEPDFAFDIKKRKKC